MSGRYAKSVDGLKSGGGDGRETRDAQDDGQMVEFLGQLNEKFTTMIGLMSAWVANNREIPNPPGSEPNPTGGPGTEHVAASNPGYTPHAGLTENTHPAAADTPDVSRPPYGPEGPTLHSNYKPEPDDPSLLKPGDKDKQGTDKGSRGGDKKPIDYSVKLDELIRLSTLINDGVRSGVQAAAVAAVAPGGTATVTSTGDQQTVTVTSPPGQTDTPRTPASQFTPYQYNPYQYGPYQPPAYQYGPYQYDPYQSGDYNYNPNDYGPQFGYGSRAYPYTNIAAASEVLGRMASMNIAGVRPLSAAFSQSFQDFQSLTRPFHDFDPYSILLGRDNLNQDLSRAHDDMAAHLAAAPGDNATDEENAQYHDALKRKQSVIDSLEAYKESKADTVRWAEKATAQFQTGLTGKMAAQIGKQITGTEEMGAALAMTNMAKFSGTMIAAPIAAAQFEKMIFQYIMQSRQEALGQIGSLNRFAAAGPIASDLAHFQVNQVMRNITIGYDVADSTRRLTQYAIEVEDRARSGDAANVRMSNMMATMKLAAFDKWSEIRGPFDSLFETMLGGGKGDDLAKMLGTAGSAGALGPLSIFSEILKAIGFKSPSESVKADHPLNEWMRRLKEPPLAPPIPPIP